MILFFINFISMHTVGQQEKVFDARMTLWFADRQTRLANSDRWRLGAQGERITLQQVPANRISRREEKWGKRKGKAPIWSRRHKSDF